MMRFIAHYSSSKGNLYEVIAANGARLIIDPGVAWKQLIKALDFKLANVVGCLLSHEHNDHSRCIEDVMVNGIDVYSSTETFEALGVLNTRAKVVRPMEWYVCKPFGFFPFALYHDVPILGFIVHDRSSRESLLFATDTSHIMQRFALQFNIIALCCNYDGEILHALEESGDINTEFAKRLLTSHMEWHETMRYIKEFCNLGECTEIHLLHMSPSNIAAEKARKEFEDEFTVRTLVAGSRR